MDKLAVELLTLISFYACTDGGQTGCALSLVSKRIHAVSRPARFFTVGLVSGPAKIEQFLQCYEAECARTTEALPRVRHLCLSLFGKGLDTGGAGTPWSPSAPGPSNAAPTKPPASRAEFFAAMQRKTQHWRSTQDNLDEQYNRVVPTLIRAVANDIETFALIQAQWRSSSVVRCAFPRLRDLIVVGGDPSFLPFQFMPSGRPLYPALKRLHHILAFVAKDVDFLLWAEHAPNITHLRISRLNHEPRITLETLQQVIGDSAPEEFFPHLQHIIIQAQPAPPAARSSTTAALVYRDFLAHVQKLAEKAKAPVTVQPPLEIPEMVPGVDPHKICVMKLKTEWMERIEINGSRYWEQPRNPHGSSR
ncbi:hypothetical protein C8Q80DRAFT_1103938 [Daedaleopsis nitida]|nr:hypothetical protein C8Q80DRAFT_1103938 [Daedaleopsis nitida]